ncbi:transporter substrate-binding domain-containing protein [Neisseriaceae bacterium TC5R-5]|nr:transporter substrate-binding domain-containing protein [Neisseriaceae bacterium TC5R-5]
MLKYWIFWLLSLSSLISPTWAADKTISPCPAAGLKVGYFTIGAAYINGQGYDVDLVKELAKRLGCKITQEAEYPRIRILKMLEYGQLNVGTSTIPTPERLKYSWILPYMYSKNMVLLSRSVHSRSLEELVNDPAVRWGVIHGYRHGSEQDAFIEKLKQRNKVIVANNENELYNMLAQNIITGALAHPYSYERRLNTPGISGQIEILDLFPPSDKITGGFVLAHSDFSEKQAVLWQAEIQRMNKDGGMHRILRRYLSENSTRQMMQPTPTK